MEKDEPRVKNRNFNTRSHRNQLSPSKAKNFPDPNAEIITLDHGHHLQNDSRSTEWKFQSLDAHQCGNVQDVPENALSGPESVAEEPKVGCRKVIKVEEDSGRERLKRHRVEVAGQVWIPDIWGQEELLKDWVDCSAFDSALVPKGILSARSALVEEGRRANSGRLRVQNSC
ncbi:hypothetical protein Ancab_014313 [Ancistrocladus abbreviatus]